MRVDCRPSARSARRSVLGREFVEIARARDQAGPALEQPRQDQDARSAAAFFSRAAKPQLRVRRIFSRAGPMLLVHPLHGRALRPTDRALDPWKLVRRMLPN